MAKILYIGNISNKATEESIRGLFEAQGEVVSLNLITDRRSGKPKGMAFVEMASEEEALQAIEAVNGTVVHGRALSVSEANTQEPRERRDLDREPLRKKRR